jgi:hypothetical protein
MQARNQGPRDASLVRVAWIALSQLGVGCSLLFVKGPPVRPVLGEEFDCTTSNFWPTWDTLAAVSDVVGTMYLATSSKAEGSGRVNVISFGLSYLVLHATSAAVGYARVDRCKVAKGIPPGLRGAPEPPARVFPTGSLVTPLFVRTSAGLPPAVAPLPSVAPGPASATLESAVAHPSRSRAPLIVPGENRPAVDQQQDQENPGDQYSRRAPVAPFYKDPRR